MKLRPTTASEETIFKIIKRLGIQTVKQRSSTGKNQVVAYITREEFRRITNEVVAIGLQDDSVEVDAIDGFAGTDDGYFYLVQLEKELDPGRFKVGFACSVPERLRHLRCSAPFAVVVKSWPCRRLWEKTAIDCVSVGCERVHTEVFRAISLDGVLERCEKFFALMPQLEANRPTPVPAETLTTV